MPLFKAGDEEAAGNYRGTSLKGIARRGIALRG